MKFIQKFLSPLIYILSVLMIIIMFTQYSSDMAKQGTSTSTGLYTSYVLLIATILGIVLGFVLTAVTNPQSIIRTIIGVAVILVIGFISYSIAGNEVLDLYKKFKVNASLSKLIGGSLILTYVLLVISILGIILSEIRSALRF